MTSKQLWRWDGQLPDARKVLNTIFPGAVVEVGDS